MLANIVILFEKPTNHNKKNILKRDILGRRNPLD